MAGGHTHLFNPLSSALLCSAAGNAPAPEDPNAGLEAHRQQAGSHQPHHPQVPALDFTQLGCQQQQQQRPFPAPHPQAPQDGAAPWGDSRISNLQPPGHPPAASDAAAATFQPQPQIQQQYPPPPSSGMTQPLAPPTAAATGPGNLRASATEGPVRQFCLTLDVRSFQASRRLPISVASAFVQVRGRDNALPHEVHPRIVILIIILA